MKIKRVLLAVAQSDAFLGMAPILEPKRLQFSLVSTLGESESPEWFSK